MVIGVLGVHSYAAGRVDTEATVKITAEVSSEDKSIFAEEYEGEVQIDLYKIATMDETGKPTLTAEFANSGIDLTILNKVPTVDEVKTEVVAKALETAKNLTATESFTLDKKEQTSAFVNIEKGAGLYLYVPQKAQDARYSFTFMPYVIFAPTSDLMMFGQGTDEWKYESVFELKSTAEERYGSLDIVKLLDSYNTGLGTASFGYEVVGKIDNETVFNNVYTIDFNSAKTDHKLVEKIPATATVTVTEIYTGASYEAVGENVATADIEADKTAEVRFENKYDGQNIIGGISTVNTFLDKEDGIYWKDPSGNEVKQEDKGR